MISTSAEATNYLDGLIDDRKTAMTELRKVILQNLPVGFEEQFSSNMINYVVPHSLYPAGYHCNPKTPLPFLSIASQKNFIAVYHMGIYADPDLLSWFTTEYPKHVSTKLDMGKSCIRFKRVNELPLKLIGDLVSKITPQKWISIYEAAFKK
ncbi:MAG: DUF1801 domain-containing protein [Flavobacterium sp.]|nr:DUF1801 domain-containing protein [Flavobacterium sp.]